MPEQKKKSYFKQVISFYLAPTWQSLLLILYLLFFFYFVVFYFGNITLALKFILFTLINSGSLLGLSYLLWGVFFLVSLLVPFFVSIYAIVLPYEIWKNDWEKTQKTLVTALIVVGILFAIFFADEVVRLAAEQPELLIFVESNELIINP